MKLYPASSLIIALLLTVSSNDDNSLLTPIVLKEWTVAMSDMNELFGSPHPGTGFSRYEIVFR
jgi:hypothetical protein